MSERANREKDVSIQKKQPAPAEKLVGRRRPSHQPGEDGALRALSPSNPRSRFLMKTALFFLLFIGLTFACCHQSKATWRGIPAPKDPLQTTRDLPKPFRQGDYLITPLATYLINGVVLSRDHYRFDPGAKIAPLDLALGWGAMSIAENINQLSVSQNGRFYEYSWKNEPPMDPNEIITHSSNTHCLPADDTVRRALLAIRRHEVVTLEGYLVDVQFPDGGHWRSSLTRDDTRGGACEVLWVTHVSRKRL